MPALPTKAVTRRSNWISVAEEPEHPLAALEGLSLTGRSLRVHLGPKSRFGARYFTISIEGDNSVISVEPLLTGLHNTGPLPTYNWVEVAETNTEVSVTSANTINIGQSGVEHLFRLLFDLIPPGGHLMVEYESHSRAETAEGLAHKVPAVATPLGSLLFRIGFGARFKDWQIAEGGSEGPRKLQAYKSPGGDHAERWRREATQELDEFLTAPPSSSSVVEAARQRAAALLPELKPTH